MFNDLINVSVLIVLTNTYRHQLTQTSLIRLALLALYIIMHSRRITGYTTLYIGASEIRNKIIDLLMPTLFA